MQYTEMQYTESERQAWNRVADFFEPNGVLDEDACEKYYAAFLDRKMHAKHFSQEKGEELLFALMKKTLHTTKALEVFARVYQTTRRRSPRLQVFLGDLAEHAPDALRKCFSRISQNDNITLHMLLLRDVQQWLAQDDVKKYTNSSLLTIMPSAFIKQFNPRFPDQERSFMPSLHPEPLPFLKKLYPEHNSIWNATLKTMLSYDFFNIDDYQKQKMQLFNACASVFLPGQPTMNDIMCISSSMGLSPLDYVMNACEHAHAPTLPDLAEGLFGLS